MSRGTRRLKSQQTTENGRWKGAQDLSPSVSRFMENRLPIANWKQKLLFRIGLLKPVLVAGDSMSPVLENRDIALYKPTNAVNIGDIALVSHPYIQSVKIIKKVSEIDADGKLFLTGVNETESTDSRTFGAISIKSIKGRIVCRLK